MTLVCVKEDVPSSPAAPGAGTVDCEIAFAVLYNSELCECE